MSNQNIWYIVSGVKMLYRNIRSLREERGWTVEEVANLLQCPTEEYEKYENGTCDPPAKIMIGLANIYHTSVDYLVGLTQRREPH